MAGQVPGKFTELEVNAFDNLGMEPSLNSSALVKVRCLKRKM